MSIKLVDSDHWSRVQPYRPLCLFGLLVLLYVLLAPLTYGVFQPVILLPKHMKSFYDLLISSDILTKTQAEQDYSERIQYLKDNNTIFTVDGVATGEE